MNIYEPYSYVINLFLNQNKYRCLINFLKNENIEPQYNKIKTKKTNIIKSTLNNKNIVLSNEEIKMIKEKVGIDFYYFNYNIFGSNFKYNFFNNKEKIKTLTILYTGLVRGFKYDFVIESHFKYLYNVLNSRNIKFSVIIYTYNKEFDYNIYKIPNIKIIVIDNNQKVHNKIKDINLILPGYFQPQHKTNILKSYYCNYKLKNIIKNTDKTDSYMVFHLGQLILNRIPEIYKNTCYQSKIGRVGGINNRFFIGDYNSTLIYLNILNSIKNEDFLCSFQQMGCDYNTNHHPETGLGIYLASNNIFPEIVDFKFQRVRFNGELITIE